MKQFTVLYQKCFTEIFVFGVKNFVYSDSNIISFWDNIV